MSQTPPTTPPQNKDKIKSKNKKTVVKTGISAMTKTFLGLLVIISIGLTIFLVNAWQQLKRANLADNQLSSGASIEVLTPSGGAPTRNPDGSVFVQQETPAPIAASEASSPAVKPNTGNITIRPSRPARPAAPPEPAPTETPVPPTNVPSNNADTQSAPPVQHKQKNGLDDLF